MSAILRRSLLGAPVLAWLWARSSPLLAAPAPPAASGPDTEWRHYGGDLGSKRYAPLDQINAGNFNDLEVAWRFKGDNFGPRAETNLESTPLVVKGRLYSTVGTGRDVVALDAATGELLWMHRMEEGARADRAPRKLSGRGLAYWTDGTEERILYVTIGYQMVALDARTGRQVEGFGRGGVVDLKQDFDQMLDDDSDDVGLHSTPCIAKDVVIVGAAHTTGRAPRRHRNAKGYVRGFDVRTGKRLWIFHTIPQKGEFGYDTWLEGTAEQSGNTGVWAQVSVDEQLNLVYLPVELPTGDYVGIYRKGDGLFGESIVAVDLHTGQRRWHYQLVHHGIWDSDIPCAPILMDVRIDGKLRKIVAQPTKQAWLYVLDRETGKPIWPIVERRVPKGDVPGEYYAPTQPFVTKPPAYDLQGVAIADLIDYTPELRAEAVELVKNYKIGPIFTPPSVVTANGTWGTITAPGPTGGANWPGGSADPETGVLYVYSKSDPDTLGLVPSTDPNVSDFAYISTRAGSNLPEGTAARGRFRPGVMQVQGLPLVKPPYGRITAIDLKKGDFLWQVPHGETPDAVKNHPALKGLTIPRTGQAGLVGTLVTKSLVIAGEPIVTALAGGRRGAMLRAYDKATGQDKGAVYLPAPVTGSPMTYMLGGVQYLVLAIGGGAYSGELVALRLPKA